MSTLRRCAPPLVCLILLLIASSVSAQVIILNQPSAGGGGTPGAPGAPGSKWYSGTGPPDPSLGIDGDFYIDNSTGDYYQKIGGVWLFQGNLRGPSGAAGASNGTYLVSGGNVVWLTGYTFRVSAAVYYINGVLTTSAEQNVTLAPADPSLDRLDAIVVDAAGAASSITGTAGAPPFEPSVDPSTALRLTNVLVTAGSTQPGITTIVIYDEGVGGEWGATPSGATIVVGSTSNPQHGTKDIEGTNVALNDQVTFVKPGPPAVNLQTQEVLVFYVRVKAAWPANKRIRLSWRSGATQLGQFIDVRNGLYGFNTSLVGVYQQIVVPVNQFTVPAGATVDTLVMRIVGGGANVGFYWDNIQLQAGINQPPLPLLPGGPIGSIQINGGGFFEGIPPFPDDQVLVSNGAEWVQTTLPNCLDSAGQHLNYNAATNAFSCGTSGIAISGTITVNGTANQINTTLATIPLNSAATLSLSSTLVAPGTATITTRTGGTPATFATFDSSGKLLEGATYINPGGLRRRVCAMIIGADNGVVVSNADLGPQGRQCLIPSASTVIEVNVSADGGTPNVIAGRNRAGTIVNLTTSALATAAAGGIACSNTGGVTGINGTTTCSGTLQNASLNAGDYLELVSGSGSTAKRMSIFVVYTID
jgi:hypothetical protein